MADKRKVEKVAFVLSAAEAEVLEAQRQRLTTQWASLGHLREATLADAARALIHTAAEVLESRGLLPKRWPAPDAQSTHTEATQEI